MISFCMLLVNNNRSKAYLQTLLSSGYTPKNVLVLNNSSIRLPEQVDNDLNAHNVSLKPLLRNVKGIDVSFDENKHVLSTLKENNIPHKIIHNLDLNSPEVNEVLREFPEKYVVYSGPGGAIVPEELVTLKKFIHVHPGWLPNYKGSTTFYYSMLVESHIAASVIIMSSEIDKGNALYKEKYKVNERDVDFDYVLDACVRACTLRDMFNHFKNKDFVALPQQNDTYPYFYIIHPMVKHLAIKKHRNNLSE